MGAFNAWMMQDAIAGNEIIYIIVVGFVSSLATWGIFELLKYISSASVFNF